MGPDLPPEWIREVEEKVEMAPEGVPELEFPAAEGPSVEAEGKAPSWLEAWEGLPEEQPEEKEGMLSGLRGLLAVEPVLTRPHERAESLPPAVGAEQAAAFQRVMEQPFLPLVSEKVRPKERRGRTLRWLTCLLLLLVITFLAFLLLLAREWLGLLS